MQEQSIRSIKIEIIKELSGLYGEQEAQSIAYWVMEDVLDKQRSYILSNLNETVSQKSNHKIADYLKQLKEGRPLQYICNYAFFRDLKVYVDENVLVPRPETEFLVEEVLKYSRQRGEALKGLDIGTGSGCIAVALMLETENISMDAVDKFPNAIAVAERNACKYNIPANFLVDDILFPDLRLYAATGYDFIISNPPYVLESDKQQMRRNVLEYEPGSALYVPDNDALLFYKAIVSLSRKKLKPDGSLFLEIHEQKGQEVQKLLQQNGFSSISIIKDMQGKDRIITASFKK